MYILSRAGGGGGKTHFHPTGGDQDFNFSITHVRLMFQVKL